MLCCWQVEEKLKMENIYHRLFHTLSCNHVEEWLAQSSVHTVCTFSSTILFTVFVL